MYRSIIYIILAHIKYYIYRPKEKEYDNLVTLLDKYDKERQGEEEEDTESDDFDLEEEEEEEEEDENISNKLPTKEQEEEDTESDDFDLEQEEEEEEDEEDTQSDTNSVRMNLNEKFAKCVEEINTENKVDDDAEINTENKVDDDEDVTSKSNIIENINTNNSRLTQQELISMQQELISTLPNLSKVYYHD